MITKTEVAKSNIGNIKGWNFAIWWDNRGYPNFVSALYKTKKKASEKLQIYLKTGKFEYYGDAE